MSSIRSEGPLAFTRSAAEGLQQAIPAYLIYFLLLRNKTAEFRDISPFLMILRFDVFVRDWLLMFNSFERFFIGVRFQFYWVKELNILIRGFVSNDWGVEDG